ncbi:hypothetical protein [Halococcus sp. IIIV-5B]|uniref:hypothetical protein n=1 Tax=Halococcus sp. IIIV-5B TaxID=2321230 RepID=UPI001313FDB1|nr:hypothetical protein [Halococcus sp. IIIV-5B]
MVADVNKERRDDTSSGQLVGRSVSALLDASVEAGTPVETKTEATGLAKAVEAM